tara:strand:+ start:83 stop:253 length:171 start_codon:yes stop_codon:yes gene_type:complete
MKVINTYIVEYSDSQAEGELAILFECKHRVYYIKYDNLDFETFKRIDREIAERLIK